MTAELERLADKVAARLHSLGIASYDGRFSDYFIGRRAFSNHDPLSLLADAIRVDPELAPLTDGWLQSKAEGGVLQSHVVMGLVLDSILSGTFAEDLIHLKSFARERQSSISEYSALCGIKVERAVQLKPGLTIMPPELVPDFAEKAIFLGNSERALFSHWPTATAFVHQQSPPKKVLFAAGEDHPFDEAGWAADMRTVTDIAALAVALTGNPVSVLGSWSKFDDSIAFRLKPGTGYRWSNNFFEMQMVGPSMRPVTVNGSDLTAAYSAFINMKPKQQMAFRTSLERLSYSMRRGLVDRALDIGIALEILLLHGMSDRGELSFRICVRGAHFVGGSKEEKACTFQTLRTAYKLRSKAAHEGVITGDAEVAVKSLDSAAELCAVIARKILVNGEFPNWDVGFEIGSD